MSAADRVARQLTIAGGVLTALAILLPPAIYFGLSYQHAAGSLETEAENSSVGITRIIASNPEFWTYERVRLAEFLARRPRQSDAERRRVLDLEGRVVAESADPVPAPVLVRSLPLRDSGVPVGRIEISHSLRPLLLKALLLSLGLVPFALAAFLTLRSVPLRVIRAAEQALRRQRDAAQSYLDVAGVAFVRLDEQLRVTLVNRQAEAVLGRAAGDVLGQDWIATFVEPELADPGGRPARHGAPRRDPLPGARRGPPRRRGAHPGLVRHAGGRRGGRGGAAGVRGRSDSAAGAGAAALPRQEAGGGGAAGRRRGPRVQQHPLGHQGLRLGAAAVPPVRQPLPARRRGDRGGRRPGRRGGARAAHLQPPPGPGGGADRPGDGDPVGGAAAAPPPARRHPARGESVRAARTSWPTRSRWSRCSSTW